MHRTVPQILRVKRKRAEEPLDALLVDKAPSRKRSHQADPGYVYKLAKTEEKLIQSTDPNSYLLNNNDGYKKGKKTFSIPKTEEDTGKNESDKVDPELLEMVSEYLNEDNKKSPKESKEEIGSDYVYDVYYREENGRGSESGNIGYVQFSEDELDEEEDNEKNSDEFNETDDEDSNSEDYYLNDYPEDEDGEDEEGSEELGLDSVSDEELGSNGGLGNDGELSDSGGFERHTFFRSDREDPIAIHRDKIFGRLQRMIEGDEDGDNEMS